MPRSKPNDQPVTRAEFQQEIQAVRSDIKTLDAKTNNLALEFLKTSEKLDRVEQNMMTKADGQKIMEGIDKVMQRIEVFDRKATTQDFRLNDHEARIVHLESPASLK